MPQSKLCNTINMDTVVEAELNKLKGLIINTLLVEQIYLFDSYAKRRYSYMKEKVVLQ